MNASGAAEPRWTRRPGVLLVPASLADLGTARVRMSVSRERLPEAVLASSASRHGGPRP